MPQTACTVFIFRTLPHMAEPFLRCASMLELHHYQRTGAPGGIVGFGNDVAQRITIKNSCQIPIRKISEMFRTLPQTSEAFRKVRKISERFGTVLNAPTNTHLLCGKSPGSLKMPASLAPSGASSTGASRTGRALPGSIHFSIVTRGSISSPGKACILQSKRSRPKLRATLRCHKRTHLNRGLRNPARRLPKRIQLLTKSTISGAKSWTWKSPTE